MTADLDVGDALLGDEALDEADADVETLGDLVLVQQRVEVEEAELFGHGLAPGSHADGWAASAGFFVGEVAVGLELGLHEAGGDLPVAGVVEVVRFVAEHTGGIE